ncbi:hypothetical protein J7T55_012517 [Diaporthe amygdali]|uniref:uncharacterized protein n=1 Tax=Phomopsis amygdali TaxID=1214568 RepID=UPI0022FE3127|nr:uncharacterized protein J7T55_012517 [Diaporthe amygdali]KAJ0124044.1 hypothetical protein J7T55_012517 [Diaporthe amygdali]
MGGTAGNAVAPVSLATLPLPRRAGDIVNLLYRISSARHLRIFEPSASPWSGPNFAVVTMARPSISLETAPFLNDSDGSVKKQESTMDLRQGASIKGWSWYATTGYVLWTGFNTVWFGANLLNTNSFGKFPIGGPTLVEPKEAPIEIVKVRWDLPVGKRSDLTSYDRAVADAAWASRGLGESRKLLIVPMSDGWLKVSKEDLDAMGETSVEFEDGSGYLMYMDVFQQLHCLNCLRKKLDPWKASYPSVGSDSTFPEGYHTAHCIDSIRLSLECHADVSMVPQRWADGGSNRGQSYKASTYAGTTARSKNGHTGSSPTVSIRAGFLAIT